MVLALGRDSSSCRAERWAHPGPCTYRSQSDCYGTSNCWRVHRLIGGHEVARDRLGEQSDAANLSADVQYKLANELYNVLPKDGTALGMIGESLVIQQALGDPAAKFDAGKFAWIGRFADSDPVMVTRPDSGIVTIEDARDPHWSISERRLGV